MNPRKQEQLRAELAAHLEKHIVLSNQYADSFAASYGLSRRTVRRQAAIVAGRAKPAVRPEHAPFGKMPLDEACAHFLDVNGNVAKLHARLSAMGAIEYSERTLARRVEDHVMMAIAQFPEKGHKAFHDAAVWNSFPPSLRNQVWEADYLTVKAHVVLPRCDSKVQAQIGLVADRGTGAVMSAIACADAPTGPDAVAMLTGATVERTVVVDGKEVVVGGKPEVVLVDNANDLKGKAVVTFTDVLGIDLRTTNPHSGWEKPFVESLNRFIEEDELNLLPAATRGPRSERDQSMYGDDPILTFPALALIVSRWVNKYNHEVKEAWGESPLQRWAAQDAVAPLEHLSAEQMRYAAIPARHSRKITGKGINFNNLRYTSPELHRPDLRGKSMEVASYPGVPEFIEVFYDGEWLCRAQLSHTLNDEQREACRQQRAEAKTITLLAAQRAAELRAARAHDANADAAALIAETYSDSVPVMTSEREGPLAADATPPDDHPPHEPAQDPETGTHPAPERPSTDPGQNPEAAEVPEQPAAKLTLAPKPAEPDAPAEDGSEDSAALVSDVLTRLTGRSKEPPAPSPADGKEGVA